MNHDIGTHIKMAAFVVLGFVACTILGQQITLQLNPPTGGWPVGKSECALYNKAGTKMVSTTPNVIK